jgi:hypothetical protein
MRRRGLTVLVYKDVLGGALTAPLPITKATAVVPSPRLHDVHPVLDQGVREAAVLPRVSMARKPCR